MMPDMRETLPDERRSLSVLPPRRGMTRREARQLRRADRTARKAADTWTRAQRTLAGVLVFLTFAIAGVAFASLFLTITAVMRPSMGGLAWMVPVGGEIAFTYLFGNGVLLALKRAPSGTIRPLIMGLLMAGSATLIAYASRGSWPSLVGHEVIVIAFYGVLLSAKSTVMILLGGKVRADRITFAEWLAHPVQAGRLWRWRATWGEPSADAARERYMRLLFAEAIAQADPRVGRDDGWRDKLPVTLAYQLATGLFPGSVATAAGDWQETVRCHVESQLALLPADTSGDTRDDTDDDTENDSTSDSDDDTRNYRPHDTADDTDSDTRDRKAADTPDRSAWPHAKDTPEADLRRMVRSAVTRWERRHAGERMPDARLQDEIQVRMARGTTAKSLLAAEYQRRAAARQ